MKAKTLTYLLATLVLMSVAGCARFVQTGNKYYVDIESRGGVADDNNPGTKKMPWKSISRAFSDRQPRPCPGDTVFVREGVYRETVVLTFGGEPDRPLVLKSFQREKPVIDGEGKRSSCIEFTAGGKADFVEIDGLAVKNARGHCILVSGRKQISLRNLDIFGATNTGIIAMSSTQGIIEKCHIHHCGSAGIYLGPRIRTWTVARNYVHDNNDDNIRVYDPTDRCIGPQKNEIVNVEFVGDGVTQLTITNTDLRTIRFWDVPLHGRNADESSPVASNLPGSVPNLPNLPNLALLFPAPDQTFKNPAYPHPYGIALNGGAVQLRDGRSWFYLRNNPEWGGKPFSPDGKQCRVEMGKATSNEIARARYIYFAQTFTDDVQSGDVRILQNHLARAGRQGILVTSKGSHFLIKDNRIHHNGASGIQMECGARKIWLEGNVSVSNSVRSPSETGIWCDENAEGVVQNNVMAENQRGMSLTQCRRVIVRRNIIVNNKGQHMPSVLPGGVLAKDMLRFTGGFQMAGGRHYHLGEQPGVSSCAFVHNTLFDNGAKESLWGGIEFGRVSSLDPLISVSNMAMNNIVHSGGMRVIYGQDFPVILDGNIYSQAADAFSITVTNPVSGAHYNARITNGNDFAKYQADTGKDAHSYIGKVSFVDSGNFNFRLAKASLGIDGGQPLTRVMQDGSGKRLPVANVWCFSAGYQTPDGSIVIPGDDIMVAGKKARVMALDREASMLVLDTDLSWKKDDMVTYVYAGAGPDIGAVESE